MADDDSALWQDPSEQPIERAAKRLRLDPNEEIKQLFEGLDASQFDDNNLEESQQSYLVGSAEVPAESQGEQVIVVYASEGSARECQEDEEEAYWANQTEEDMELILQATQEYDYVSHDGELPVIRPSPQLLSMRADTQQQYFKSSTPNDPDCQHRFQAPESSPEEIITLDHRLESLPLVLAKQIEPNQEQHGFLGFQTAKGRDIAAPSSTAQRRAVSILASSQPETEYDFDERDSILLNNQLNAGGFQTARGGKVTAPSSAALRRAHTILASSQPETIDDPQNPAYDEFEGSQDNMPPPSRPMFQPIIPLGLTRAGPEDEEEWRPERTNHGPALQITAHGEPATQDVQNTECELAMANTIPEISFRTGGGRQLAAPSEETMRQVQRLTAYPSESQDAATNDSVLATDSSTSIMVNDALALQVTRHENVQAQRSSVLLGAKSEHRLTSEDTSSRQKQTEQFHGHEALAPQGRPQRLLQQPPRQSFVRDSFRTPLRSRHSVPQTPSFSPSPSPLRHRETHSQQGSSQQDKRPDPPLSQVVSRRVHTHLHGTGPRRTARTTFRTPFKDGIRPPPGPIQSQTRVRTPSQGEPRQLDSVQSGSLVLYRTAPSEMVHHTKAATGQLVPAKARRTHSKFRAVFDLSDPPYKRTSWTSANLTLGLSALALEALGLPQEIIYMDSRSGEDFKFSNSDSFHKLGWQDAQDQLVALGARLVDDVWVKNHWTLILWKQAGILRAMVSAGVDKESARSEVWSFSNVLRQLLYRYEREINQAQRSAVKRIQEQDSSPRHPMVLLISNVFWTVPEQPLDPPEAEQPGDPDTMEPQPQISGFELTDGWYRINAQVDPVLAFAFESGKLSIGSKLLIIGAKLEAGHTGSAVLDAQDNSYLAISANSTRKAPWDAKLGFCPPQVYISTLRSLSPLGGTAPLIDVVVRKLYPVGFMEGGEEGWEKGPWNLAEEEEKQRLWLRSRSHAEEKAYENLQKHQEDLTELVDLLESSARKAAALYNEDDAGNVEDFIESLLEKPKYRSTLLASRSKGFLREAAEQARADCQSLVERSQEALKAEVEELCPLRNIRSFRVARITDAVGKSNPSLQAQLTIWNSSVLEELEEGKRYLVSNVRPARPNGWSRWDIEGGEIFLTAGWNSTFQSKSSKLLICSS